ncbi:hypothetical protein J3E68DRAFT_415134 [Trichoderma sp. SZMC 28012]
MKPIEQLTAREKVRAENSKTLLRIRRGLPTCSEESYYRLSRKVDEADRGRASEMLAGGYLMERARMVLNGAMYRRLSLASMDVSNVKLATPTARLLQRFPDLRQGTAWEVPQGMPSVHFFGSTPNVEGSDSEEREFDSVETDESGLPAFQRRQETRKARSKPIPAVGTKEVDQVAMFEATGGLQWNFYNTRPNPKCLSEPG